MEPARRDEVGRRAAEAAAAIGYTSAGTMEFLRDGDGSLYFMEMNTRLQVEHPVTEMITGVDIVKEQIRVAANRPLSVAQEEVGFDGHAIEFRINAEDPDRDFSPDPGEVTVFEPPSGGGIRVDTHLEAGAVIPPFYDSMIAKLIVHGADRQEAIHKSEHALAAFRIEGVASTIPIHRRILAEPDFREGHYDTLWLERLLAGKGA
jgi:acetyl-CoA carboxylase biotin carboxylase subunit